MGQVSDASYANVTTPTDGGSSETTKVDAVQPTTQEGVVEIAAEESVDEVLTVSGETTEVSE